MAKKTKKKAPAKKKAAARKKVPSNKRSKAAPRRTKAAKASRSQPKREIETEIVFSYGEIDFLRKITKREVEATSPRENRARLSLRDKLLDINFSVPNVSVGGLIVVELSRGEVDFLQRITKEVYSFITAEERRARLILREKILIAVEKVTGKKILPDEPI